MPRGRSRRPSWSPQRIARVAVVAVIALLAAVLTITVGIANISRSARPAMAMRVFPADARAQAKAAEQALKAAAADRKAWPRARELSVGALMRDPTVVPAWRTLAATYALEGDEKRTGILFNQAQKMSRRDLLTQLWFIEEAVARNDIPGALRHYDIALRTNNMSRDLLFPVLVKATAEPPIIQPLADLLLTGPEWRRYFLARLAENPPSPDTAVLLVRRLAAAGPIEDREVLTPLVPKLVQMGAFDAAGQAYQLLGGTDPRAVPLRNGNFQRTNALPPFDWALTAGVDASAEQAVVAGKPALEVRAGVGQGGVLARQLVVLPPGAHRLQWQSGRVDETPMANLRWVVTCSAKNGRELLQQPLAAGPGQAVIEIPSDECGAQWIDLTLVPDFDPGGAAGWVRSVAIRRL